MKTKVVVSLLALAVLITSCHKNGAPQITSIESLTEIIVGGSEVKLVVDVSDEDGDILTYDWSASGGKFLSDIASDSIVWLAPTTVKNESYLIKVEVSDGELPVMDNLQITVEGGKFIDNRDDNIYGFVQIGDQIWMSENLAYLPTVSYSNEGSDDTAFYYVHSYEGIIVSEAKATDNYNTYGVLYNWKAARAACPEGWYLPWDEDWAILEKHLGMSLYDAYSTLWRSSGDVGIKLKSTKGWNDNGNGTNLSGFNALPGGYRYSYRGFTQLGEKGCFWSSSENNSYYASLSLVRILFYNFDGVYRYNSYNRMGQSVRCLKN